MVSSESDPDDPGINGPAQRYLVGTSEAIDIIRHHLVAQYGEAGFRAYCEGNAIKYRLRAGKKHDADRDLLKAAVYEAWARGEDPRKAS